MSNEKAREMMFKGNTDTNCTDRARNSIGDSISLIDTLLNDIDTAYARLCSLNNNIYGAADEKGSDPIEVKPTSSMIERAEMAADRLRKLSSLLHDNINMIEQGLL